MIATRSLPKVTKMSTYRAQGNVQPSKHREVWILLGAQLGRTPPTTGFFSFIENGEGGH